MAESGSANGENGGGEIWQQAKRSNQRIISGMAGGAIIIMRNLEKYRKAAA